MIIRLLIVFFVLLSCFINCKAQITDNSIEQLMTRRRISCFDISYNAVSLIPRLYKENKKDTLDAVVNYWRRNCGMSEPVVTFSILYSIENNTFKEQIKRNYEEISIDSSYYPYTDYYATNILSYLRWFEYGSDIMQHPRVYFTDDNDYYIIAKYGLYYDFLRSMADSLTNKPGLTPVEKFLLYYYSNPDKSRLSLLSAPAYNGSVLQEVYLKDIEYRNKISGFQLALTSGIWVPKGKLSTLGNHPYLGFTIGGRSNKLMYDVNFSFRFLDAPNNYIVTNNDTPYTTKYYMGYYIGYDIAYQFFRRNKHEFDILCGIGWDAFDAIFADAITNTYPSLNLNAGLGYKIFLSHKDDKDFEKYSYLSLQAKYNFVNYNNKGGTDLSGNSFTFGLLYGFYKRANHYYYNPQ